MSWLFFVGGGDDDGQVADALDWKNEELVVGAARS
jgi:hypothetical protein